MKTAGSVQGFQKKKKRLLILGQANKERAMLWEIEP
jgi:hypothetical protein